MARTLPGGAGERTLLASGHINIWPKLEVKDSDGTWRDLTNLSGVNWLDTWRIEESIDTPIAAATFVLRREVSTTLSLAPNLSTSTINRNAAAAYVPLLTAPRLVRFSVATVGPGVTPVSGDYHEIFQGPISSVDPADPEDGITIKAFDLGYLVQQAYVEADTLYSTAGGTLVETVMQQIITAWVASNPTLVTPVSPAWLITTYTQAKVNVLQAIRDLAQQIGWDIRYLYQAATNTPELRFYQPPRGAVTPDWTFGPTEYTRIPRDSIDDSDVRNAVTVIYVDAATGNRTPITRLNSASITKFGRRWMEIQEDASSNIDSAAEGQAMADAAVADLGDPLQDHEIETLFFWPLQLNDLCRFSSNNVQYDSNQDLACVGFTHEGQGGHATTTIQTRGKPAGAYSDWLRDAKPGGTGTTQAAPPYPQVGFVRRDRAFETVTLNVIIDPTMLPTRWQTQIDAAAYSALQTTALPQNVAIPLKAVAQKLRLRVIQADGQLGETEYNVPPRYDDSSPTHREDHRRTGWGGLPTGFGLLNPHTQHDRSGATPLLDPVLGQVTDQLGASDGVKGIESTRGAKTKAGRAAGLGAHGITEEGRTRGGNGGMPTPGGPIHTLHQYTRDGTIVLVDAALGQVTDQLGAADGVKGVESTRGAKTKAGRSAGAGAQGIVIEGRTRAGMGGLDIRSMLINAVAQYDATGASPLIDPVTQQITTNLNDPNGRMLFGGRMRAKVKRTAVQSISNVTATDVLWDGEDYDASGLHDNVTNNARIIVPAGGDTGVWYLAALIYFAANATGVRSVIIQKSTGDVIAEQRVQATSTASEQTVMNISGIDSSPAAGDYYKVIVYQSSGGNLNIDTISRFSAVHLA